MYGPLEPWFDMTWKLGDMAGWRKELPVAGPAQCSGEEFLVSDGLRPRIGLLYSGYAQEQRRLEPG